MKETCTHSIPNHSHGKWLTSIASGVRTHSHNRSPPPLIPKLPRPPLRNQAQMSIIRIPPRPSNFSVKSIQIYLQRPVRNSTLLQHQKTSLPQSLASVLSTTSANTIQTNQQLPMSSSSRSTPIGGYLLQCLMVGWIRCMSGMRDGDEEAG